MAGVIRRYLGAIGVDSTSHAAEEYASFSKTTPMRHGDVGMDYSRDRKGFATARLMKAPDGKGR